MGLWTWVVCLAFIPLISQCWDLKSVEEKQNRRRRNTKENYNDWKRWPNASKLYDNITCENELRPYPKVPLVITDPGYTYDVKTLDVFKTIGDAFLDVITRKSLFETIELTMELTPLDSMSKILKIVEYQLTMVILIVIGVLTASTILVFYIIFWSLKLTGNITEVKSQRIADSEGPMRFVLSFLLSLFTVFVMFGCIIAWVANTHISNNVNEASKHIQWSVTVTENFTQSIEQQMNVLFLEEYRKVQLGILRTRLNQAVVNASAYVYLELAQNVSDTYNKSLILANSIGSHQKQDITALEALYSQYNKTLYNYLVQIKESQTCLETIQKWCDAAANSGKCDPDKEIKSTNLTSVDPEKWWYDEIISAKNDVINVAVNGALGASARLAYYNGKFFHNGTLEDPDIKFYGEMPSYTNKCLKTDLTTGILLSTDNKMKDVTKSYTHTVDGETKTLTKVVKQPINTIEKSITCSDADGCKVEGTSTVLFWGECCVTIEYGLNQSDPKVNNTDYTKCGPKQIIKDDKVQPGGNQSEYRGNISVTVTGKTCKKWAQVNKAGLGEEEKAKTWDAWAASQKYYGLYYLDDPEDISFQHNFCRNPSPQKDLYGTKTDDDVRTRAWCFYGTGSSEWEYCNVPFCAPATVAALKEAEVNGTHAFHYPTCKVLETKLYGADTPGPSNFTMWKTSKVARDGAYFALDEASSEMAAQMDVINQRFNETNKAFDELKKAIIGTIDSTSKASEFDNIRNIGTICIVTFCMISACLAVAGVCMGYCNISDVPPHLRTPACSMGGRLIKISSYWAAMMAIINLFMATLFFIPGSAFSLVCKDYYSEKLFELFDEKVIVNYSVLGRAILDNDTYPMTFKDLWLRCKSNKTLWESLGLSTDPDYDIIKMMQLNESLDVNATIATLLDEVSLNFEKYPAYPANLKAWLGFWNASNGTQLKWATLKTNLAKDFLGVTYAEVNPLSTTKLKYDGRDFCDAFSHYGSQVTATDGDVFECKQLFTNQKKIDGIPLNFKTSWCTKWVLDYETMDGQINALEEKVKLVQAQQAKYGLTFMEALMEQYDFTNNNLLNKGTTFSKDIITKIYHDYWQPVMNNEVNCFTWQANYTLYNELAVCYPIAKILDNTMNYFCGYMVSAMTLAWMSQGLLGLVLTLHMLVASSLATYFLKLEERHPDDISKEDMIAGFE